MTPFANATSPVRAAALAALALAALALFLFVASNVLLLGLRAHDGGFHLLEIVSCWLRYGADKRLDRWLMLSTLAGLVVAFGMLGAVLRRRPLPLHGKASFASSVRSRRQACAPSRGCCSDARTAGSCPSAGRSTLSSTPRPAPAKASATSFPICSTGRDSVVVLDIKKENSDKSAGFRAAHGQEVHLFDPFDANGRTARYNPLSYVRSDQADLYDDLQRIAVMLFPAESRGDPFWTEAARSAFIAIGGYIAETPDLPFTIGEILRQLTATQ